GRGQWPLQAEAVILKGLERVIRQIETTLFFLAQRVDLFVLDLGIIEFAGDIPGMGIEPVNSPFALVNFLYRCIEYTPGARRDAGPRTDVPTNPVPSDQAHNGIIRDVPTSVCLYGDARTAFRRGELLVSRCRHET